VHLRNVSRVCTTYTGNQDGAPQGASSFLGRKGGRVSRRRAVSAIVLLASLTYLLSGCSLFNAAPTASFRRSPEAGNAPLSVFFDASASADPDGTIVTFAWSYGDGRTGDGVTTTHTYASAGLYETKLSLTDDGGANGTTIRMVTVTEPGAAIPVGTHVGEAALNFTLQDLDGKETSLSQFRGYVVLLDFWASGCAPCTQTLPYLETLRKRYAADGLVLVGVSLDENALDIARFLATGGYSEMITLWESHDAAEKVKDLYGIDIPHTFLIDRQGVIRWSNGPIHLRDRDITPWL